MAYIIKHSKALSYTHTAFKHLLSLMYYIATIVLLHSTHIPVLLLLVELTGESLICIKKWNDMYVSKCINISLSSIHLGKMYSYHISNVKSKSTYIWIHI